VARLATIDERGRPHLVPIVFAIAGDTLYSVVRSNPWVCALADHYDAVDWAQLWWVRADGAGRVLASEQPEARAALVLLAQRYPHQRAVGEVLAIDVERWSGWSARDT
jgi:hypothetical protein